jgi:hypothetical protein
MTPPPPRGHLLSSPVYPDNTAKSSGRVWQVMTTQSASGPSAGVPKMAITMFTKTPAEHVEEKVWPTIYGPGKFSPKYWRRVVEKWRDGREFPEWVVPDPPPG